METTIHSETPKNMAASMTSLFNYQITEVKTSRDLKRFLALPAKIYPVDSRYVMPLSAHMKMMMGKLGTPKKHFFLAEKNGEAVARIGFKVHENAGHTRLHFGFFECLPGHEGAVKELVAHGHKLYPELEMMGPFQFRQEDPYVGLLVEGFDLDPYFMMPYNPPTYDSMLQKAGLTKAMDLYTYDLHRDEGVPDLVKQNAKKSKEKLNLTMRTLDIKNLNREARIISGIFNEALAQNWGFEEFTNDQINEMVTMLKLFIDPRMVHFAMHEGKEIGCLIMIPNYNHLIKPCRGKLTAGLIWRYFQRAKTTDSIRGYALGVLKKYQGHGIGSALTESMFEMARQNNIYSVCEVSWVLANNSPMNDLAIAMGGKQNKVYRIYQKAPIIDTLHN